MLKRFVFILLPLAAIAFAAVFAASPPRAASLSSEHAQAAPSTLGSDAVIAHPGPWGEVAWSNLYLEAPDYITETIHQPGTNPQWIFPGTTEAALRELFARAGLPAELQHRLLDAKHLTLQAGTATIEPSIADLEGLKPEAREVIYAELAKYPANEFHHDPVIITGSLEDWLRDTELRPELQNEIRRLTYHSGRILVFSDVRLLFNRAASHAEAERILKTVTRMRTLVGELKISPKSNSRQLLDYWTAGRVNSDVLPILESALERSGGATLDVMHLLPPLPRRRIYTFPSPDLLTRGRMPDCHWTSLNFFNLMPQDYYLDMRLAANCLLENYAPIEPPYRFGDLLCLLNAQGQAVHSCVYIADDVVYTKNGENTLRPWILMPLQEVKDYYSREATGNPKGFRRKVPNPV